MYPYSDGSPYRMSSYGSKAISSITKAVTMTASGNSITVNHTAHGLSVGEVVNIFDSDQSGYDGNRTVATVVNANRYTFTASSSPAVTSANGFARLITLAGFLATMQEYANVAHNNLDRPVVCGEYGLVKANTQTTNPLNSFPKSANHDALFRILFDEYDFDGIFLWHFTNLFDDDNFNIKPDGPHTGGNANGNANDSDFHLLQVISGRNARFKVGNKYANSAIKFFRIKYVKPKKKKA